MKKLKKSRKIVDIILIVLIVSILLSNIFGKNLEILFKLRPNLINTESTQVHFIDVGQGDAIAIRFADGKTMLVDSGTESYLPKLTNYLDNIVLKGGKKIDYVVLTHPDSDHSSNMAHIVNNYEIGTFYRPKIYEEIENKIPSVYNLDYRNLLISIDKKNVEVRFNEDGIRLENGDIGVKWLMPHENESLDTTNDYSPILIVEDNGVKLMLTGDISGDIEEMLIEDHNSGIIDLNVDILKLAHHGSKYSSSYEFLKATSPNYVVTSVGENTYGHPANDVIERLLQYDEEFNSNLYSTFLTTKESGNIIYTLEPSVKVEVVKNIDDYVFVSYWVYSLVAILVLAIIIIIPHSKVWYQNIRFIIRNKNYRKDLEKRKNVVKSD